MKKVLAAGLLMLFAIPLFAEPSAHTQTPKLVEWSNDGMTIYNEGRGTDEVDAVTIYTVGGATTTAAYFRVCPSSISFTTVGGLYPGTTWFVFADSDKDTLTELVSYAANVSTDTAGAEGGITITTTTAAIGATASTNLTETATTTCKGSSLERTLTVTPPAQTSTFQVNDTSVTFVTTGGLYPGTYQYSFGASSETVKWLIDYLNALDTNTAGIDGQIVAAIPDYAYVYNLSHDLTETAAQNIIYSSNTKTLDLDNTLGIMYCDDAVLQPRYQRHVTGLSALASYTSGSVYLKIYNGTIYAGTEIFRKKFEASDTDYDIRTIPDNGDFAGDRNTAMTYTIVGSTYITGGYFNIIGHRE